MSHGNLYVGIKIVSVYQIKLNFKSCTLTSINVEPIIYRRRKVNLYALVYNQIICSHRGHMSCYMEFSQVFFYTGISGLF